MHASLKRENDGKPVFGNGVFGRIVVLLSVPRRVEVAAFLLVVAVLGTNVLPREPNVMIPTYEAEHMLAIAPVEQEKVEITAANAMKRKENLQKAKKRGRASDRKITAATKKKEAVKPKPKIVDTSSWARSSDDYNVDQSDLWENLHLPEWLTNYLRFHKERTTSAKEWTESNMLPSDTRYLYLTCVKGSNKCGGLADRLTSLPFLIKVAAETKRVLLIQWTRPKPLEDFLMPPISGIDWRVPELKQKHLQELGQKANTQDTILEMASNTDIQVVQVNFQSKDHGSLYYDSTIEKEQEEDFKHIFHKIWKVFFTPAPALAVRIQKTLHQHNLVPGEYSATHVRAMYNAEERENTKLVSQWSKNSIACSIQLQDKTTKHQKALPVYFASDSDFATRQALFFGKQNNLRVVSRDLGETKANSLHLDKVQDWKSRPASDWYDTFIDLYVLSQSRCLSYGLGGYGKLASFMSEVNTDCSMAHMTGVRSEPCRIPKHALRRRVRGIYLRGRNGLAAASRNVINDEEEAISMDSRITNAFLPPMEMATKKKRLEHHYGNGFSVQKKQEI